LHRGGLPQAWASQPTWRILDTHFDLSRFLAIWQAWQADVRRPRLLHYVGIANAMPRVNVGDCAPDSGDWPGSARTLAQQLLDRGDGFHRILLSQARVSLTLCIGDPQAMLAEQVFKADTLLCAAPADKWALPLLARRCKRGTRFWMDATPHHGTTAAPKTDLQALAQSSGFELDSAVRPVNAVCGTFNPRWNIPTSRTPSHHVARSPGRCAVIGAGIAGPAWPALAPRLASHGH
jgi:tRNA 5-methylaminomethyl-2-thiouridine biosynthesis bifunctional protein